MFYVDGQMRGGRSTARGDDNMLARATNEGDRAAAAMLLRQSMPLLVHTSRAIAGRAMEPEELLSSALLATWEKWSQGRGPVENALAYIAQTMRNRLRDEMRAPRSKNVTFDPLVHELTSPDETERVHSAIDHAIVTAAMARLSDEQRLLLHDVVVDGRKPQTVGADLGRSSARVSSAVYRAKVALRTELVLECLRRACSTPECLTAHREIALLVGAKSSWNTDHPVMDSARRCSGCWAGLQSYASLSSAASVPLAA